MIFVFYPTRNFRQFWADPTFSVVRSTFLGRPLKDVRFYPMLNFGHFGVPSVVTLLTFQNVSNLKHPKHPKHPKHTQTPKHQKTRTFLFCSLVLLFSGPSTPPPSQKKIGPSLLTLWKVKGDGGPKMAKILYGAKPDIFKFASLVPTRKLNFKLWSRIPGWWRGFGRRGGRNSYFYPCRC